MGEGDGVAVKGTGEGDDVTSEVAVVNLAVGEGVGVTVGEEIGVDVDVAGTGVVVDVGKGVGVDVDVERYRAYRRFRSR